MSTVKDHQVVVVSDKVRTETVPDIQYCEFHYSLSLFLMFSE